MEQRRGRRRRDRGRGRGQGSYIRSNQTIPLDQQRGQRNYSRRNNENLNDSGYVSPQPQPVPSSVTDPQYEDLVSDSSKQMIKMRTVHPEELGIELKQNSTVTPFLPRKPEKLGNLGRRVKLISNCFPIVIPSGYVYHYDIKIEKRIIHVETEAKVLATDNSNLESGTKTKSNAVNNTELTAEVLTDNLNCTQSGAITINGDQSVSDSETKPVDDDHKKYKCLNTKINRKVFSYMIDTLDIFDGLYPAFDGKNNLYTRNELQIDPKNPYKCEIILPDENIHDSDTSQSVYDVTVKPVKKLDTTSCAINLDSVHAFFERKTDSMPEEAMMAVETVLRHTPCLRFTPIARSFYYSPDPKYLKPIGGGIEIWFGYHQSVRLCQWKPTVNIDTAATTFLSAGPVLNYIVDATGVSIEGLRRIPFIEKKVIEKINHQLNNKEIRDTHLKYRHRIVKITNVSANETIIQGKDISVTDYFKQKYGIRLKYPNLPCIQVKPEDKKIFLPPEVCEFTPGQHYRFELTPHQKSNMIKFTTISPVDRFKKIDGIVKTANFDSDKCVREFDLKVSKTPLGVEGRVLDSPNLKYADGKKVSPKNGTWNMMGTKFLKGGEISHCMLIAFQDHPNLEEFGHCLMDTAKTMGINTKRVFETKIAEINDDIEKLLSEAKKLADLVVVFLPPGKEEKKIYASVKKTADTLFGIPTQCIKEERLDDEKRWLPIIRNICLKINPKTGGENYDLVIGETPKILCKPVIIIGADVTHPAPTETSKKSNKFRPPSIVACVGSLDSFCKRFAVAIRPQSNKKQNSKRTEEIICDLESIIEEILRAFYRHTNGKKPEKIILYRDGVSEGEFAAVKNREVVSVRKACMKLESEYKPPITFIVVQKRHHVRFKTEDPRDSVKDNAKSGTVIDTVVTHPLNNDFFLISQPGNKGTSRPSYYTVIEDDNDFSANDLQKMTYQFCHMYVRCTKSISVPAPVRYAHLMAYRARKYLQGKFENIPCDDNNSTNVHIPTLEDIKKEMNVLDGFKGSMFFV